MVRVGKIKENRYTWALEAVLCSPLRRTAYYAP